ncbi:MAG: alkaline phosphatase D family protein [Planctomycetales bacterium]|nr:alkaline phosphatase D family protein [Planctomycetales bacterium]
MFDLGRIREAVKYEGGVSRRLFVAYGGALAALPTLARASQSDANMSFSSNPFTLGVASGDPGAQQVVLWTRLAPSPTEPGGGMPNRVVSVNWEIATDDSMRSVVAKGTEFATPPLAHSVHVEVNGLEPGRWYWYRFHVGDAESPIGRTRTMPARNALPGELRFAFTSCQNYEQGLFTAYEHMVEQELDLVFHLGDYIYEYEAGRGGKVRTHIGNEINSLDDYRIRHSQYRTDPLLQAAHARCPWFLTFDDHEFDNNCAADISEEPHIDPADYLIRRANAYQAYYEMMPLPRRCLPQGPDMRLFRRASFGRLADFMVLDTRQYRTDQPNGDGKKPLNQSALLRTNTLLGAKQKNWLSRGLVSSQSLWNVLAQQVMMGMVGFPNQDSPLVYSMDQWPGYASERMELMQFMADRRVPNPVVLTGDIHSNWVNELRVDDRRPETNVIATEFVATSLSSGGNGPENPAGLGEILAHNPCVKFHNGERGYVSCTVTPEQWRADYLVVDDVLKPGGKVFPRASFVVESGNPIVHKA